jgi:hypothetical protein
MRLEGLGGLKKSNGVIGNRTRDLPACSIVPQPTTLLKTNWKNNCLKMREGSQCLYSPYFPVLPRFLKVNANCLQLFTFPSNCLCISFLLHPPSVRSCCHTNATSQQQTGQFKHTISFVYFNYIGLSGLRSRSV